MTAEADWALIDAAWPKRGPCLVCGVPGVDQRHRVLDAVAGMLGIDDDDEDGDDADHIADEYGLPVDVVEAVGRVWKVGRDT